MTPLPVGFAVRLEADVQVLENGRVLVGGSPRRRLRLSEPGFAALERLAVGQAGSEVERALGRRLIDTGLARPYPPPLTAPPTLTFAIPVRDDAARLVRLLAALPAGRVLVVDDGSANPATVANACHRHGAELLRREEPGGPAAARNAALAALDSELVALLDVDTVPGDGWLDALLPHFADPLLAAAAPRIRPLVNGGGTWRAYARAHSPLDLGPRGGEVAPLRRVAYVPSAALVVRRGECRFDESLRYGEDVDLVWRLAGRGLRVRYVPEAEVLHEEPDSFLALLGRRYRYGTSAAPLSRRHPGAVRHQLLALCPREWSLHGVVDGAAYGAGVWRGCLAERTAAPLLPHLGRLSRRRR